MINKKKGRPKKPESINSNIDKVNFSDFRDIINTYMDGLKNRLEDEDLSDELRIFINAFLDEEPYKQNILILKVHFKTSGELAKALKLEDMKDQISYIYTNIKKDLKKKCLRQ